MERSCATSSAALSMAARLMEEKNKDTQQSNTHTHTVLKTTYQETQITSKLSSPFVVNLGILLGHAKLFIFLTRSHQIYLGLPPCLLASSLQ